ncbi:ECF subfamily RNA polymerase sigma factor, BldN family [Streptomyces longwoodensis]|uniref:Sigma-70 family RNA polymerase sigma factor n=1 Tax=Streptomyces lasalocidi TaxID=324833 RepID=A0A4V6AW24_STRLS|nr:MULTISPECIES: ECF subfamily RNA polymerase sigma factor, BldN family [Streptomyces]MCX4995178.1 sigma-70 family RNA polymerase sigma factor [Streptomyces longwoodensis]TKT02093.1 sigma-70 family RNA polymerase sigma factor [Streptomyces lasalocidi]WRY89956.1 sigma-70 family RNA polymerase sigma factor [Streptomyces longwoodensis]WTI45732.1 sigma-70 family RNA polymerase sigma factor [Streptomyces longwoodensis]WUC58541.1 sigma-70 family RNA polymerase sigma factor [Streptomyces longwoodensi
MYPHVGVDASGLATLRATVATVKETLRGLVPTAYAVPALATAAAPAGPAYALADGLEQVPGRSAVVEGRRAGEGRAAVRRGRAAATTARRPAADSDSARMMDLVERAQAGEADAFGRLYDQYSDTVYRYIYYRVGGRATAEDLTSETFLRALRRIGTFTWQGRDFGAWLVTIARNLVADHFKSSRFRLEVTTGEMLDANEVERSPEDSVLESLSNAALLDAVRRLNPQQQECVTLRFLQGLSVAETARVMGKNEGAIKTLQYRAVRTLARLLPDDAR